MLELPMVISAVSAALSTLMKMQERSTGSPVSGNRWKTHKAEQHPEVSNPQLCFGAHSCTYFSHQQCFNHSLDHS